MQDKPTGGKGRRLTFRELKTEKGIRESRMTVHRRLREQKLNPELCTGPKFPPPFVDHGRTYWWESEIDQYNAELESLPPGSGRAPPPKKDNSDKQDGGE